MLSAVSWHSLKCLQLPFPQKKETVAVALKFYLRKQGVKMVYLNTIMMKLKSFGLGAREGSFVACTYCASVKLGG